MLVVENQEHFDECRAFAEKTGHLGNFEESIKYLTNYGMEPEDRDGRHDVRCLLAKDFAPYSFRFVIERFRKGVWALWLNGGLIFHGDHDGGGSGSAPTFAVCAQPTEGWLVHT